MTFTKRMHPRNKYRTPPDFRNLAIEFEEFREFAVQDLSGKVLVDFKNADALRALTRVLLKKDWDLDVCIPPDRLVPTLPLRLNYLLWLEDLLMSVGKDISKTPVHGIDIGTGAACIYPLLAAKKNKWHMLATEVDEDSVNHAKSNVKSNKLEDLIKVQQVSGDFILKEAIEKSENAEKGLDKVIYDFCMCNPPFYSNEDEMDSSSTGRSPVRPRNPPRNARTGSMREVVFEGGEVAFVTKMIEEGKELQDKLKIMTTMLGHKSSVSKITKVLNDSKIKSLVKTEFCQGRTMRWGIAWSHSVDLSPAKATSLQVAKKEKSRPPQQYIVPENCGETLQDVANRIIHILDTISVRHKLIEEKPNILTYQVTALENSWSNQRRKRREEKRMQGKYTAEIEAEPATERPQPTMEQPQPATERSEPTTEQPQPATERSEPTIEQPQPATERSEPTIEQPQPATVRPEPTVDCSTEKTEHIRKRNLEDCAGDSNAKRFKKTPLLIMTLVIRNFRNEDDKQCPERTRFAIEVCWIGGSGGRELPNQVLQYVKNNMRPAEIALPPE